MDHASAFSTVQVSGRPSRRKALLLGTALTSMLIALPALTATPVHAQTTTCTGGPAAGPTPILEIAAAPIVCVNADDRVSNGTSADAIYLLTSDSNAILLDNRGALTAEDDGIQAGNSGSNIFGANADGGDATGPDGAPGAGGNGGDGIGVGTVTGGSGGNGGGAGSGVGGLGSAGGSGGNAVSGPGGDIIINNGGIIVTTGDYGAGITVFTAGGVAAGGRADGGDGIGGNAGQPNGGNGGNAIAANPAGDAVATGGAGGMGGLGATGGAGDAGDGDVGGLAQGSVAGDIFITNSADIFTSGQSAYGISAVSLGGIGIGGPAFGGYSAGGDGNGGNGGDGGDASASAINVGAAVSATATGGSGGSGGEGGVGGAASGGSGFVGGDGIGAESGDIVIVNGGDIATSGLAAPGIFVISRGGSGFGGLASGGAAIAGAANGGAGGGGGDATVTAVGLTPSVVATAGDGGDGGAGGSGGSAIGGNGGSAGDGFGADGGDISITNFGDIFTSGDYASGIEVLTSGGEGFGSSAEGGFAQGGDANGGAGGVAGAAAGAATSDGGGAATATAVGGDGGAGGTGTFGGSATGGDGGSGGDGFGGNAGNIVVVNSGAIRVSGVNASGISVRSFGGAGFGGYADGGDAIGGNANGGDGQLAGSVAASSVGGPGGSSSAILGTNGNGNSGGVGGVASGGDGGSGGDGIGGDGGDISIVNSGDIVASGAGGDGIFAFTVGGSGFSGSADGGDATGGSADGGIGPGPAPDGLAGSAGLAADGADGIEGDATDGVGGAIFIENTNGVLGNRSGVTAISDGGTTLVNSGLISASSLLAININGGAGAISNSGTILGFVDLTDEADSFTNESGGVFEARLTSDFGGGDDLFTNEDGGVVDTATNASADESVSFVNLESFDNFGLISLVDGQAGDLFTIANVVGASNLEFTAGSELAVDVDFSAGRSDIFRIDGNVSGDTDVFVNQVGGLGTFQPDGIRVVEVTGDVDDDAFRLANGPIDTGFFNFDLFAEDDGTQTNFELRSFVGAGAFILPQLVTATQDIWHQTSDTWFNRSADLRTALRGGEVHGGGSLKDGPVVAGGFSPAVWAKASAGSLDRDDRANTSAFGRSFEFDLNRELFVADFQTGIDFGKRGVLTGGDALLVSVFGGGVFANLDYDRLDRRFDIDGGQVGVAATYLSGGLFVDALFNAQFLEVEADNFAFPEKFDAETYGFRLDTGYRFQRSRFFFEPLLTLSVAESDLDGFSVGGNTVAFEEETSVRGRVGLRAGTTTTILGVHAEPYVIASYWSELGDGDTQRATLTSGGSAFALTDSAEESWTEISFGSNYFLFGNNAVSAFTKTDIVFGHDIDGYNFTGGFRVQW